MSSSKYAVTNILKDDYEPFQKYCNEHDIIIKDALAEAIQLWLAEQTLLASIQQVYIENKIDLPI